MKSIINDQMKDNYQQKTTYIDINQLRLSKNYIIRRYSDSTYYGEIINELRTGKGAMKYDNGRIYEGEWQEDFRHGKGYEIYHNGNTYEGDYQAGKAHGKGVYKWANGEIYDGEWAHGLKHGDGVWKGICIIKAVSYTHLTLPTKRIV